MKEMLNEVNKTELEPQDFKRMLPSPVKVITTMDANGLANAAPYGCIMPILRPLGLITIY